MTHLLPGFQTVSGHDAKRDGPYLELIELETGDEVAEAFYVDEKLKLLQFKDRLSPELIAAFVARAKATLAPKTR